MCKMHQRYSKIYVLLPVYLHCYFTLFQLIATNWLNTESPNKAQKFLYTKHWSYFTQNQKMGEDYISIILNFQRFALVQNRIYITLLIKLFIILKVLDKSDLFLEDICLNL